MPSIASHQYATQLHIEEISCVQTLRMILELDRADATCARSAESKPDVTYHAAHLRERKWLYQCPYWQLMA